MFGRKARYGKRVHRVPPHPCTPYRKPRGMSDATQPPVTVRAGRRIVQAIMGRGDQPNG